MSLRVLAPGKVTLDQLAEVYWQDAPVCLDGSCREAVEVAANAVAEAAEGDAAIYGVNTGFGKLASMKIARKDTATLQRNLILSHCCGVGDPISRRQCFEPIPKELERLILSCLAKRKDDRPSSAQALADALDKLELPRWTRADAERWWQRYGPLVEEQRDSIAPRITGHTMDVVIDEPWFEGAGSAPGKS